MHQDKFGERIKAYERDSEVQIDKVDFMIVRLDGHKFSKFTKDAYKPFDYRITNTMIGTLGDLIEKFGGSIGYTQSDEMCIVFPPTFNKDGDNRIFSGRTQKIATLMASYASIRFNANMKSNFAEDDEFFEKVGTAFFDARVFAVPNEIEAFNAVLWRVHDCKKNSISMLAQSLFSHKALNNKSGDEKIQMSKDKGHDWHKIDERYKYGTFIKKELYTLNENVTRTRLKTFSRDLSFSDQNVDLIIRKYY